MVKSLKEELQDLNDWKEILGERLKERLSGDMPTVVLLGLLLVLFLVVLLGGFVISSSEHLYAPILAKIIPTAKPTHMPVILATAVPTVVPTMKPVPTKQVSQAINATPTNSTTLTPTPILTPIPTSGPVPTMPWNFNAGSDHGVPATPTPLPDIING